MDRKEAIEVIKKNYPHVGISGSEFESALRELVPELKESKDERIRKAIESIIRMYGKTQGEWIAGYDVDTLVVHLRDAFAYLERQREQKPAETSNIDLDTKVNDWVGYMLNDNAQSYSRKNVQILLDNCARFFYDYAVMCLDKPAEWSEEDERRIVELKTFIAQCNGFNKENQKKAFDMIDAIRPQPHWKPSKEQISAIEHFIRSWGESGTMSPLNPTLCAAKTLLDDLKKL